MNKNIIKTILVFSSVSAFCEVPNTFESGKPAYASEVNENFTYLDEKSDAIALREGCSSSNKWWEGKTDLSYEYKAANVGETVTLNGKDHVMTSLTFKEFSSGDLYKVTMPVDASEPSSVYFLLSHVGETPECNGFLISGFPASTNKVRNRKGFSLSANSSIESSAFIDFTIKIKETQIGFFFELSKYDSEKVVEIDTNEYDGSSMTLTNDLLSDIDDIIDYIKIEKL